MCGEAVDELAFPIAIRIPAPVPPGGAWDRDYTELTEWLHQFVWWMDEQGFGDDDYKLSGMPVPGRPYIVVHIQAQDEVKAVLVKLRWC